MIINIIEPTQRFHFHTNILFLVASSWSLFPTSYAQLATQPVPPGALNDTVNPSLAILLVVLIFAFFITAFCCIYLRHCSETYAVAGNTVGPNKGIDPEVLAMFPIKPYSTVKTGSNVALQCAVCLGEFTDMDKLRLLPKCRHVFHRDCIDAWLASHVTCPVCRAKMKPDCGEIDVEIGDVSNAHQVFDESSVRRGEVVCGENEGGFSGNVDGCVGKENGSSKMGAFGFGVLVRSHSTGHSLVLEVEPGKTMVERKQILDDDKRGGSMMKRSASYDVVLQSEEGCSGRSEGGEGSSSKGKKDGVERQTNRWVLSVTPPFVSRGWGSSSGAGAASTCSGIPRLWASSFVREDRESEGRTIFQVL